MGREIRQKTLAALEAVCTVLGLAALAFAGWYDWGDYDKAAIGLVITGVVLLGFNPLSTVVFKIKSEAVSAKLQERGEAMATLVEITHGLCDMDEAHDLRVTLLELDSKQATPTLKQVTRCGVKGRRAAGGSTMTIHQGVAGEACRKVESLIVDVDISDFENAMVKLGFTKEEARRFEKRGAYLCTPIVDSMGNVMAVLSLDAKDEGALNPEHVKITERLTPFFTRFLAVPEGENHG